METSLRQPASAERRGARRLALIVIVLVVLAAVCVVVLARGVRHPVRFITFDVGQGDALFLEAPTGEQMLIDGGPSDAVLEKLGRAMPFFDRSIDVVVLTHPDADHLTGIVEVLRRYRVGRLLVPGTKTDTATYAAFVNAVRDRNVPVSTVRAGDTVQLGLVTFTVLAPFDATLGLSTNNAGIVARADAAALSILLTADVERPVEDLLVQRGADLDADVLKVGHHGSKTSTSEPLLHAVSPDIAVISVGVNNSYGHPSPAVLDRLSANGVQTYRTDVGGDIRLFVDGETVLLKRGLGFRVW